MRKILLIQAASLIAALSSSIKGDNKVITIDSASELAEEKFPKMETDRWNNHSKGEKKRQRSEWNRAMKGHRK